MSVHLPGRRRLRTPKLQLTSRKKGKAPEVEAPKAEAAPEPAPPADPDPEPEPQGEEGVSWSPDMGKDELVAAAQALGIYDSIEGTGANGNVLKDDIIKALEAATEN